MKSTRRLIVICPSNIITILTIISLKIITSVTRNSIPILLTLITLMTRITPKTHITQVSFNLSYGHYVYNDTLHESLAVIYEVTCPVHIIIISRSALRFLMKRDKWNGTP